MAARQCESCGGAPGGDAAAPLLRSVNITECVSVPSSEHVAEIVGRQGCKIKALRAKTNTYIKTPMRGEEPVFVVTGHKEDVAVVRREILLAAEHFSLLRASTGREAAVGGPRTVRVPVRVPYHLVGLVVGPRGSTVKRIQQRTGTCILSPSRDMEPVFEVTGTRENVDRAREEIEMHIALRTGNFLELGEGGRESGPARAWPDSGGSLGRGSKDSGFGALWAGKAPGAKEELLPNSPAYEPLPVPSPTPWAPLEPVGTPAGRPRLGSRPPTPRVSPAPPAGTEPVWGRQARSIDLGWPQRGPPAFSPGTGSYSSSNGGSNSSSPAESHRRSDCLLCLDGEATATLLPCGHNLFCALCARSICGRAVPACPVCQAAVTHAI